MKQTVNMDLNPVVHDHDSKSFEASKPLANMIAFIKGQLFSFILSLWFVFLWQSIKLFRASGKTMNLAYLVAELILMGVAVFVSYILVNRVKPVVEITGRVVSITNETVLITPFTFNLRFWRKKLPQKLVFEISELRIRKTDNPLRFVKVSDSFKNRVFELRDKNKIAYIVFDYYDAMLKEKLTDILVEVTPPELLIPEGLDIIEVFTCINFVPGFKESTKSINYSSETGWRKLPGFFVGGIAAFRKEFRTF